MTLPPVHCGYFIDCFITKMDNFCVRTGISHRDVESEMGLEIGWLNRVATKTLRPHEYYPNFTLWAFLDLLTHRPDLVWFHAKQDRGPWNVKRKGDNIEAAYQGHDGSTL